MNPQDNAGESPRRSIISGRTRDVVVPVADTVVTVHDVVGMNQIEQLRSHRLPAGEVLSLIDICAARCTGGHIRRCGREDLEGKVSCATVAADDILFKLPLLHGDSVRLVGRIICVGSSSLTVHVDVSRMNFPSRTYQHTAEALLYFVVIGADLRPLPNILPAVEISEESDLRLHYISVKSREAQRCRPEYKAKFLAECSMTPVELNDDINKLKRHHLPIEATRIECNRMFFPAHLNINQTIFGGELMRWMEASAVHCGRVLTGNRSVVSVAMHSVEFKSPVFLSDWLTLTAEVVYVRNTTCEVDVVVSAERKGKTLPVTTSSFILMQLDDIGQPAEIPIGIDLERCGPDALMQYAAAKARYQFCRANRKKIRMADVEEMEAATQS